MKKPGKNFWHLTWVFKMACKNLMHRWKKMFWIFNSGICPVWHFENESQNYSALTHRFQTNPLLLGICI
jgi:hypothetical protein